MTHDSPEPVAPEITCREVAEWTSAYLDEHLHDSAKVRMALHLATCAGCHTYVNQIDSVKKALGSLPVQVPEPAQRDRLRQAFTARYRRPPIS